MLEQLGVDINRNWSFNADGDLILIKNEFNLGQAILNRLLAESDTYDIFYAKYGGNLGDELGELNHPNIHEYIKIEIERILSQDPRISEITCTVDKIDSDSILCDLNVKVNNSSDVLEFNLVIGNDKSISISENMLGGL